MPVGQLLPLFQTVSSYRFPVITPFWNIGLELEANTDAAITIGADALARPVAPNV